MIRIINSKRSVALLVALCVLCVSCLAIPVHATGIENVAVPAIQAIVSEMIGMGLERTGGNDAMTAFAQNICQLPEMASYIVQNGSDYFVNAFKQGSLLFLPYAMISLVRDRLFAKGSFTNETPIILSKDFTFYTAPTTIQIKKDGILNTIPCPNYDISVNYTICAVYSAINGGTQFYVCGYDNNYFSNVNIHGIRYKYVYQDFLDLPIVVSSNVVVFENVSNAGADNITGITDSTNINTEYQSDYSLGVVAPYDTPISEGYATWASGAITVPNSDTGEDETFYPVGVGSTLEGTLGLTQEQVWSGVTDITTETTDIATNVQSMKGTLSDVLESVNTISDVFTTTQTVSLPLTALHFDELFTLFPFSIPKDLVDCIGFWNADADAPTISVPLPKTSGGFGIQKYDVPFEDIPTASAIVAILRAGQIILFCVGLLVVTRKITKW